jgi:hypothetical protein
MEREKAIEQIQEACKTISLQLMRVHPAARALGDAELQGEILKTAHAITTEVETIKKRLLRARDRDDSAEL